MQRHALCNDGERTRQNTGASNALNSSADDEGDGVWRAAADQGTNFEQAEGDQEDPFDLELDVQLAEHELEAAGREQVGRAIPGYIFEGVEVACDFRDGCRDDRSVLIDEVSKIISAWPTLVCRVELLLTRPKQKTASTRPREINTSGMPETYSLF